MTILAAGRVVAFALVCWAPVAVVQAGDWQELPTGTDVAARTIDGRVLRGRIDSRTTADALWLAVSAEGVDIVSTTPAADVVEVTPAEAVTLPPLWSADDEGRSALPQAAAPVVAADRVNSVDILALPANWDADPQVDGLRLWVLPRNARGELVAVNGSLRGKLLVESGAKHPTNRRFVTAEQWQQSIAAADFAAEGAMLQMPFRKLQPEGRSEFPPLGALQVRLIVPGQGAFDAVLPDVLLTLPSYNRDRSELTNGSRYFPGEVRAARQ